MLQASSYSRPISVSLLLLYCCFTAALLLLYCCFTAALLHSLRSWAEAGLLAEVREVIVFLQDISETDLVAIPRELEVCAVKQQ